MAWEDVLYIDCHNQELLSRGIFNLTYYHNGKEAKIGRYRYEIEPLLKQIINRALTVKSLGSLLS